MTNRISEALSEVRQRLWLTDGATAACLAVAGALLTLFVGMWLDLIWELPAAVRAATWGCAGIALICVLCILLTRTWKATQARHIARRMDQAAGCGGQLLNGWEFCGQLAVASPQLAGPLTSGLATLAVERAELLAGTVRPGNVISNRTLVRALRWLALILVSLAAVAVVWPALAHTQWRRFISPWSDTPPYSPFQFTVEPGDVDVLYGKGLDVRVAVTGPLVHDVDLLLMSTEEGPIEKLPMFPEANGSWRASLSRLTRDTKYFVSADRARSPAYRIHIITTPKIEEVRFKVTPPAYTHDAPYEGLLPKDGLVGLAGTKVEVTVRSNRPLAFGEIRLPVAASLRDAGPSAPQGSASRRDATTVRIPLTNQRPGDSAVSGQFHITRSTKFEIDVTDTERQSSDEPFVGSITLLTDQRPVVRILEPKPMSLATPTSTLPVVLDAEDDYGLARVELYRSLNDSRPMPTELPLASPPPRRFREQHYLPLQSYGLQPGDEIKLFARVTDNDPVGAKGTESAVVTVRIISQADFERMVRVREGLEVLVSKYQQAERRLESLAKEIESLEKELEQAPADSPMADSIRERLKKLSEELRQESEAIAKAAEHELPYDIDKNLKKQLEDMAKELANAAQELDEFSKDPSKSNAALRRQMEKLKKQLAERKANYLEEVTEPLDTLSKVYPLLEDQARYVALVLWQKDIAERLGTFKNLERSEDPATKARMRDLQDEQRRAKEELVQLLDDMENHITAVPEGEEYEKLRKTATDFVAAVRSSGAVEAMSAAEEALGDFRGAAGYENAKEAAEILEQFLSKCEGVSQQGSQCLAFNPSLNSCLGDSIEQLLADAGLSMGRGQQGQGQGRGGYSARSGGNQVGLYGGLQSLGGSANSGRGFGGSGVVVAGKDGKGGESGDPAMLNAPWSRSASGAGASPIPPQYRRRVSRYFQRVAEELEEVGQ